jgi:hypothetical protein
MEPDLAALRDMQLFDDYEDFERSMTNVVQIAYLSTGFDSFFDKLRKKRLVVAFN